MSSAGSAQVPIRRRRPLGRCSNVPAVDQSLGGEFEHELLECSDQERVAEHVREQVRIGGVPILIGLRPPPPTERQRPSGCALSSMTSFPQTVARLTADCHRVARASSPEGCGRRTLSPSHSVGTPLVTAMTTWASMTTKGVHGDHRRPARYDRGGSHWIHRPGPFDQAHQVLGRSAGMRLTYSSGPFRTPPAPGWQITMNLHESSDEAATFFRWVAGRSSKCSSTRRRTADRTTQEQRFPAASRGSLCR